MYFGIKGSQADEFTLMFSDIRTVSGSLLVS